ncbi:MAG: hypothetical protein ACFFFG_02695 [Candidatus Thorarchaeota archaeon]
MACGRNYTRATRLPSDKVLAQAEVKYGHWTNVKLTEYRMTHGHCVVSQY